MVPAIDSKLASFPKKLFLANPGTFYEIFTKSKDTGAILVNYLNYQESHRARYLTEL